MLGNLVTSTARLGDDLGHLVDLRLSTAEGTELWMTRSVRVSSCGWGRAGATDSLLGQLAGALVLGVAQQLDHTALVGGKAGDLLDDILYHA